MPIELDRWGNTAQNGDFRNKTNNNWDKLEKGHNTLEQTSSLTASNVVLTQKQLDEILIKGKNLFNKKDITPESYLDNNTGGIFPLPGYFVSDYIRMYSGNSYTLSPANGNTTVKYYDVNKSFISNGPAPNNGSITFTPPSSCVFVRFGQQNGWLDSTQLEFGSVKTPFEPYNIQVTGGSLKSDSLPGSKLVDNSMPISKLDFNPVVGIESKNIFNKNDTLTDKYIAATGALFDLPGYFCSNYIIVKPNANYYLYGKVSSRRMAFYDNTKVFIKFLDAGTAFVTPDNAKYLRYSSKYEDLEISQIEKGSNFTGYEMYGNKVDPTTIPSKSLSGGLLTDKSITPEKMKGVKLGKNFFNKNTSIKGKFVVYSTGLLADNNSYFASDYISVESNIEYIRTVVDQMAFYTADKVYISGKTYADPANFTTPVNCAYVRICAPLTKLETYQLEKGNVSTTYEEYGYELEYLKVNIPGVKTKLYSFKDAWTAWENDEKFPVGFMGDSTTDGVGTTGWTQSNGHEQQDTNAGGYGKVDYINTKAYPYLLEQLIKQETGKPSPRIYNIGYSGTYFDWMKPKLNDVFSGVYSDIKMIGITYGINDRTRVVTSKEYETMMRTNLDYFINYFYNKGIQPFLVTSQATVEPYVADAFISSHPQRTSERVNSIANRVKKEMAVKYNLEIIDMTEFGEHAFVYSAYSLTQLINDTLHFGDKGHELEAGFLFSKFCPRVITTRDSEILGFSSQKVKSLVSAGKPTFLNTFEDGFKVKVNYTKTDSNDMVMLDFWLLNYSKKQLNLKAFLTSVGTQYVMLNDVKIPLTANSQSLGTLDIGLHRIQAFTGETTNVDLKGFALN
ncbi:SGNH/GDSL hydrolase family protein [Bacillus mycoides]|uniref:SGNH/GDSL hydrolase family protein n=1 Tax=Bacillus mycoides TaxID=1405 RepID=UPI003672E85F